MKQKEPRVRDPGFLAFLRRKPCCYCGRAAPSEAAHIRYSDPRYGKINPGMQQKPHDFWAVPLCAWCHREGPDSQHNTGDEKLFWAIREIDPCRLAIKLYAEYGGTGGTTEKPKRRKRAKPARKSKIPQRDKPWPSGRKIQNRKSAAS